MAKIYAVANYVVTLTESLSKLSLEGPFTGNETLNTETYFLDKNIQPTLRQLGILLPLKSRTDIDRLVRVLMSQFDL
jgi:hypothetical protein